MKRLCIIFLTMLASLSLAAQKQSFEFYYIAHDRTTPVSDLCSRLEQVYETALSYEDYAVIFYLPNYDAPITVKVNLPGDNRKDFKNIISELRLKPSHEIFADVDYQNIINLINAHDFIDDAGTPAYTSVLFCWYVTPDFWQFNYNEELIARLYFNLELEKFSGYVETQIMHSHSDGLEVDARYPFGTKNLCKNMGFMLLPY